MAESNFDLSYGMVDSLLKGFRDGKKHQREQPLKHTIN
jgi:hypothetical protein